MYIIAVINFLSVVGQLLGHSENVLMKRSKKINNFDSISRL